VAVDLRGTRAGVDRVTADDLGLMVDASGRGPGEYDVEVRVSDLPGITVESLTPATVKLRLVRP
jgi:YbbR domain-containing protein